MANPFYTTVVRMLVTMAGAVSLVACSGEVQRNIDVDPTEPTLYVIVAEAEGRPPKIESTVLGSGDQRTLQLRTDFGPTDVTAHLIEISGADLTAIDVPVLGGARSLLDVLPLAGASLRLLAPPTHLVFDGRQAHLGIPGDAHVRQIYPHDAAADPRFWDRFSLVFTSDRACPDVVLKPVGKTDVMFEDSGAEVNHVREIDAERLLLVAKRQLLVARRGQSVSLAGLSNEERRRTQLTLTALGPRASIAGVIEDPRPQAPGQKRFLALVNLDASPASVGLLGVLVDAQGFVSTATDASAYVELADEDCFRDPHLRDDQLFVLALSGSVRSYDLDGHHLQTWHVGNLEGLRVQHFHVYEDPELLFGVTSPGALHVYSRPRAQWTTHSALPDPTATPQSLSRIGVDVGPQGNPRTWLTGQDAALYVWSNPLPDARWIELTGDAPIVTDCLHSSRGLATLHHIAFIGHYMLVSVRDCNAVMIIDTRSGQICHSGVRGQSVAVNAPGLVNPYAFSTVGDELILSSSRTRILSISRVALQADD